jgi:hypothetical protein
MELGQQASLSDLDSRGYILIRGFLNADEIQRLSVGFEHARVGDNSNYHVRRLSVEMNQLVSPKCKALCALIRKDTGIDVDTINDAIYFATFTDKRTLTSPASGQQKFPWHQDHENFWQWQDNKNYLNFYIPVVKPILEKSNLGLMPFDSLRARNPELAERLVGHGASRVLKTWRGWVVRDDNSDRNFGKLGFDPAEIEEIPYLAPGDLLLMRGDLIHRSQDADTRRIAISVRMINGKVWVDRSRIVRGGLVKSLMLFNARSIFSPTIQYFHWLRADRVPASQLNRHMEYVRELEQMGYPATTQCGRIRFLFHLLRERIRALIPRRTMVVGEQSRSNIPAEVHSVR